MAPWTFAPYLRDVDFAVRTPWHSPQRRLLDYLLVYIQEGDCLFTVEDVPHRLHPGQFCLIQPGERVELRGCTETVTPYAHFDVFYNLRREESFATRPGQLDLTAYQDLMQPRLDILGLHIPTVFDSPSVGWSGRLTQMVRLWESRDALSQIELTQTLGDFVLSILKKFDVGESPPPRPQNLSWIPSFLSTHLAESISVGDMARHAHLSSSRFQSVFRDAFGVTPGRYLMQMRIQHAAELLVATDWTLAHIAQLCGFADVHHFAKAFKREMRLTPGQHRRGSTLNP